MKIAQAAFHTLVIDPAVWSADWAWGLPLIVFTVLVHVSCLGLVSHRIIYVADFIIGRHHPRVAFIVAAGTTTLLATCLHGIEAGIWCVAYFLLGALPNIKSSMLYSLNAMTSYGHTDLSLAEHWQLMGALEALNGWLLFGLTTAFLFAVIEKVGLSGGRGPRR
jgi:hypothetical protein